MMNTIASINKYPNQKNEKYQLKNYGGEVNGNN